MPKYLNGHQPTTEQINEWIEYFHTNGFLVINNVLTPEQCELLRNDLNEALKQTEGKDYHKSKKIMKRMFEHSQFFYSPRICISSKSGCSWSFVFLTGGERRCLLNGTLS